MLLNGLGSVVKWLNFEIMPDQARAIDAVADRHYRMILRAYAGIYRRVESFYNRLVLLPSASEPGTVEMKRM